MKLPVILLSFLITLCCLANQNGVYAQTDTISEDWKHLSNFDSVPPIPQKITRQYSRTFDSFLVGPRINYTQGKYGFLGASASFAWHETGYVFESHIGISAGMDFRLTKSMVYAPKINVEYRYLIWVARVGYHYFTDFKSDSEHRISAEIGLSLLSFLDITYLHSFGSSRNPFQLNADYLNITATIPLNL
jgi:hypothetical protein